MTQAIKDERKERSRMKIMMKGVIKDEIMMKGAIRNERMMQGVTRTK